MTGQRRARPRRRGRRARLPARLEPLADRRVAGEARRDPRRHRPAGLGDRGRRLDLRRRGGAGLGPEAHGRAADRARRRASTGTASTTCRAPGRRRPATARRRARPTTGTSTWACCARTARRSRPLEALRRAHAGARHLPVVPLRGPPARRRGRLAEAARRHAICAPACPGPTASGPNALAWFDRQMEALAEFDVTVTFCFTPEHRGIAPAPHQPAAGDGGVRRVLRRHGPALRGRIASDRTGTAAGDRLMRPRYVRRPPPRIGLGAENASAPAGRADSPKASRVEPDLSERTRPACPHRCYNPSPLTRRKAPHPFPSPQRGGKGE